MASRKATILFFFPIAAEWTAIAMVKLEPMSTSVLAKPIFQLRWWLPAENAAGYRRR